LRQAADEVDVKHRAQLLSALDAFSTEALEPHAAILQQLADNEPLTTVKIEAWRALARLGTLEGLSKQLQDEQPEQRLQAMEIMCHLPWLVVEPYVSTLVELLVDPVVDVRYQALTALLTLGVEAVRPGVPSLQAMLTEEDSQLRLGALEALRLLGAVRPVPSYTACVFECLNHAEVDVRRSAVTVLAAVGPVAAAAAHSDALAKCLGEVDLPDRVAAFQVLSVLEHSSKESVAKVLEAGDSIFRWRVMHLLAAIGGRPAASHRASIMHYLSDKDVAVRQMAGKALAAADLS